MNVAEKIIFVSEDTVDLKSPIMPYINRQINAREFTFAAKIQLLIALLRCELRAIDPFPCGKSASNQSLTTKVNSNLPDCFVSIGYNSFGCGDYFNSVQGLSTYYSPASAAMRKSRALSEEIFLSILSNSRQNTGRSVNQFNEKGVISGIRCPSSLVCPGFLTNIYEARLMLDPDWAESVASAIAIALCDTLGVGYTDGINLATYPTLGVGDYGSYVQIAEYYLILAGKNVLPDGKYTSNTEITVREFQTFCGLTASGRIDQNTWAKLILASPESTVLSLGKKGNDVRYLQQKLLSKLYPVTVDGIFGDETHSALIAFQQESDLTPDGIATPLTWSKLLNLTSPRDE